MTTREDIVAEARRWLGTPFGHQGRVLGEIVDCGGIIVMTARRFDLDGGYVDPIGYPREPHIDWMERLLDRYADRVPIRSKRPGDIITFAFARNIHHIGILTEQNLVLHAWNRGPGSTVIETRLRGPFAVAMRSVYKFRGID